LGGIGGTYFTPIINKPEVAILGIGKGAMRESKLLMPIGLSYDHRVVDGADGARFVRAFAEALENFNEKEVKL
jgi:pyruvate dehydrogenase E2 component (dihydrolipoamide acetyltransferase)